MGNKRTALSLISNVPLIGPRHNAKRIYLVFLTGKHLIFPKPVYQKYKVISLVMCRYAMKICDMKYDINGRGWRLKLQYSDLN